MRSSRHIAAGFLLAAAVLGLALLVPPPWGVLGAAVVCGAMAVVAFTAMRRAVRRHGDGR
jgi:hypothetical protein